MMMARVGRTKKPKPSGRTSTRSGPVIALSSGVLLSAIALFGIASLLHSRTESSNIGGLDVLHDCTGDIQVTVAVRPSTSSSQVVADVSVERWEDIGKSCSLLQFHFPGIANVSYLIEVGSPETWQRGIPSGRKPLEHARDALTGETVANVRPSDIPDFTGTVEFTWGGGLQVLAYDRRMIRLHFGTPHINGQPSDLKRAAITRIQALAPEGYILESASPVSSSMHLLPGRALYDFQLPDKHGDLEMRFTSTSLSEHKDYWLILLSTLLGIGLTLLLEGIRGILKA